MARQPRREDTWGFGAEDLGSPMIRASEAVKQLAQQLGVPLANVDPTGPDFEVLEEDVRRAAAIYGRPKGSLIP